MEPIPGLAYLLFLGFLLLLISMCYWVFCKFLRPRCWLASPDVPVVSCAAACPAVTVVSSLGSLLAGVPAVAGVPTAANAASSVTDDSAVSGVPAVVGSLPCC